MTQNKQLQELLDGIRSGGVQDSEGTFTLDRFSAARKLARTQFPNPYFYAVKLVQWAVASRASKVSLTIWPGSVEITHNGQPIGDHLPDLIRFALASPTGPERRLVHLASAILAVQALAPRRVEVRSQSKVLRVIGETDRCEAMKLQKFDRVKVSGLPYKWSLGSSPSPWSGLVSFVRPEVELVNERCGFSEIPIFLNGDALSRPFLGIRQYSPRTENGRTRLYIPAGHSLPLRVALAPAGDDPAICVPGPETAGIFPQGRYWMRSSTEGFHELTFPRRPVAAPPGAVRTDKITLGDFPMYRGWAIMLDYTGNLEHRLTAGFRSNNIRLIQDGALVETVQPSVSDRKLYAEGIVATGSLPLDLSHYRFVRGPELTALVQEVTYFLGLSR